MDSDKKTEDNQQDEVKDESALQAAPGDASLKRKLEDAETDDGENGENVKKAKLEEGVEVTADEEKESCKKEDPVPEGDGDKDLKAGEKRSSPGEEEETKADGGEDKENADTDEQVKSHEQMEVDESTIKTETPKGEEESQQKSPRTDKEENEVKKEEPQADRKPQTDDLECKRGSEVVKEEKTEVVQRRYPTRNRSGGGDKGASQSAKISGSNPGEKKATSGSIKEEVNHDSDNNRAASVKSDNGSDKENLNSESAGDGSMAGTPDIITLTDEEETEEERKLSREKKTKKRKLVRRLQAQLRNEEAKLVLLKKLRQSQLAPQVQDHPPAPNNSTNQINKQPVPRQQGGPPPLVRGNQPVRGSNLHLQQPQNRTPSQSQIRNIQGPPPLVGTPRMGANTGASTTNGHGNQNVRNNTPHLNQHSSSNLRPGQQQQTTPVQHQQAATPPQPPVDTQTPAQRQAAAKLALRKQLEKTLLQIPPPKPPAPEMNFIPSLACPDFVLLLGLEEVVNHIIDLQLIARGQKSPDEKFICNPFTCVQCGTDYTPVWKREKPGSKNVICEHCVTWNQKRALKQEHTNRLKSAFVKALQQEQEIERMQAQNPSNPSTPTPSVTPPTSASSSSSSTSQSLAAAAAASNVAAAAAMSMGSSSFRPSAEQVRQHHFLQAQAQLRAGQSLPGLQGFGSRSPFPYNLPYVKQADLQRQYLLDMMPRGAGMPWKQ